MSRRAPRAFSLVELVLMLAIIATLAAIAAPRYANSLALYRAQSAANRIVADVNLARWRAKASSAGQTVVFDLTANAYTMPGNTALAGQSGTYAVKMSGEPYLATLATVTFAGTTLSFDRYGQPAAGGTVTVQSGNATKSVVVDAVTGQASVQ